MAYNHVLFNLNFNTLMLNSLRRGNNRNWYGLCITFRAQDNEKNRNEQKFRQKFKKKKQSKHRRMKKKVHRFD